MRSALVLTLSASLLAVPAVAQTSVAKRPMTFADLQAMKRVSDPQISPSGKWVMFSVTDVSLEKNTKINHLWVVPLDGSAKERQLTSGAGESNGRFSPDGKAVLYSADDQISLAAWDEAAGTLGAAHAVTSLATGADGGVWASDSKHILFTSSVYPECESQAPAPQRFEEEAKCNAAKDSAANQSLVKAQIFDHLLYRHWNQYVGPKHSHIFYASVDGGTPEDLTPASVVGDHEAPTFSLGGPLGYAISPDGKEIAYEVNLDKVPAESTNNDIFILQLGAAPSTAKKVSTSPGSDDGPQYSPDGKYLAWRSQARAGFESDRFDLAVMNRATGEIHSSRPMEISNGNLTNDNWVDEFAWAPDSKSLADTSSDHGSEIVKSVDPVTQFGDRWTGVGGEYSGLTFKKDGAVVATKMRVDLPSEIVVLTRDAPRYNGRPVNATNQVVVTTATWVPLTTSVQITHLNETLIAQLELPKQESFTFAGANGTEVQGFLIRPPDFDPSKKYPLKFLIHGGPQGAWGDAWSYRWNPELFAANGYVVVMINPRGSTGYGQQFVDEVSGDWGGRPYVDLMKGLDYVENKYPFIDKKRECALGASYGGFMADYILTHTDRFACIVTHDGMYNPQSAFGTTEELWFNEWEFRPLAGTGPDAVVDQAHPAHPWDFYDKPASEDPFRKFSPMLSIDNAKTPTLVIHGQKDYRLDISEGLQLFTALQLRHVPSKMLYFPDEGHWVLKPQNSQLWYETVNDWVDQWTHTNAYAKK